MEIDAYRSFGIFSTKGNIEVFEKVCNDMKMQPECLLEFFIDSLARSFNVDSGIWRKEDFGARAFYEALKEALEKEKA